MIDRYGYTAPARVKVLVVPVNGCSKVDFERYFDLIRSTDEIRLLDIPPIPESQYFNPQSYPHGKIMYEYSSSYPEDESIFLHDFEPFRKTFIVISVGKYLKEFDSQQSLNSLKKLHQSSIVHNSIIFDTPSDLIKDLNPPSNHDFKLVFYHDGSTDHNITAIETLVCEVSRNFLLALDNYASSYLNITLRSPVSITDSHILTRAITQAQKRLTSGSSSFKLSFNSSNTSPIASNDIKSKHNGRQAKLLGSFFLLAGKTSDALHYFIDAIINLKKSDDFLWLGSAIEGLGIASVMLHFLNIPFQLNNPALLSALQFPKSKLQSINSETSPKRLSSESKSNRNSNPTLMSPRNSTGSSVSFNLSQLSNISNGDLNSLPLPELIKRLNSKVLHLYHMSTNDYENTVPDIVYIECLLRSIKFMVYVHLSGPEIDSLVLERIVKSKTCGNKSDNTWFTKSDILAQIDKVFSLQLVDMDFFEQCRIYCALASMYTDLGLKRKRAFILRILIIALLPKFETRLNESVLSDYTSIGSIRDIFDELFIAYGINVDPESTATAASQHPNDWVSLQLQLLKICLRILEAIKDYSYLIKLCTMLLTRYTHCLPPADQIALKEKIDALIYLSDRNNLNLEAPYWDPFLIRKVKYVSSKSKDSLIPFPEYERDNHNVGLVDSSPNKDSKSSTPKPDESALIFNPYNKAKFPTLNKERLLIKNEIYQLKVALQNPFSFEIEVTDFSIMTEGNVSVQTLKHLMRPATVVGLNDQQLPPINQTASKSILNSKHTISAPKRNSSNYNLSNQNDHHSGNNLLLHPKSIQYFIVAFKPLEAGALSIVGFDVAMGSCNPQFFQIIDEEFFDHTQKIKVLEKPIDPLGPLESVITNLSGNNIEGRASTRTLQLSVVPPQPTLSLTNILINNGWLMLLEGEKYEFSICLTNHSDEPINYLSFSFWDSTIEPLSTKLNSNTLSGGPIIPANEVYEIEWLLLMFKPFRILNKEEITSKYKIIQPHSDLKINYEITGKRGMKELRILLDYSNKLANDVSNSFVKNVNVPLNLTVMPSIELIGCDILPLLSSSLQALDNVMPKNLTSNLKQILGFISKIMDSKTEDISEYCLLVIDMRNSWNEKLSCNFTYTMDLNSEFKVEEIIDPMKTSRFLLPIRRISSNDIDLSKPVPSLRNKQFIKNYFITDEEELKLRETFWLRYSLLEKLKGDWETVNGNRRDGIINLRGIRLSPKMANVLVYSKVQIHHTLIRNEIPIKKSGLQFLLDIEEFYTLKTKITNNSEDEINAILRHIPFPLATSIATSSSSNTHVVKSQVSIDRKILVNGLLQNHLGESIKPQESIEIDLPFVILEKGQYEWGSVLDVLNKDNIKVVGREPIYIAAS
ncbi:Trs120-domain-containing protein [Hyphopichia burtonii NRRL Y-1933]|uniref:Trs120-domain-containing protein n=1 Tax=Hyphopichia burtonii NRRL Y-1933 TaxID=984485 RepID=A0A1E4RI61_9ASCO|nr:Trs120-domain-containing protein [Hyphopichia burtonii NRRL Y-1933]ODV66957.1 Trs120-domain-containing protein [Hyphopichia burtonii NRRL Y-1933]